MASRKITRSAKKTPASAGTRPAAKTAAKPAAKAAAKPASNPAASKAPAPQRPAPGAAKPLPVRSPLKPTDGHAATSRAGYLQAGLEALVRRVRLRDQAEAKKLEPALAHLAKAYGKLLGKA